MYTSASRSGTTSTTDSNRSAMLYSTTPPDVGSPVIRAKGAASVKGPRRRNLTECQKPLVLAGHLLQPVLVPEAVRRREDDHGRYGTPDRAARRCHTGAHAQ